MKPDPINWPTYVPIPTRVGSGVMYRETVDQGRVPCCALGHAHSALGNNPYSALLPSGTAEFQDAYVAVACAFVGFAAYSGVIYVNDHKLLSDAERALVYNAAWAYLGYTEGQSEEVLALVKKAKKLAKKLAKKAKKS